MSPGCPVRAAAERDPDGPALVWQARTWSWAQLDELVAQLAAALEAQGVRAGQRVPFKAPNEPELVVALHALGRLGAVYMPLNVRLTSAEAEACLRQVPVTPAAPGTRVALFTSGTTGVPKLVELSDANLRASAAASAANLGTSPSHRWLGTLPLFHIGGIAMAFRCAVDGAALWLEPGFDAQRVNTLVDQGATHLSLVPTTLERLLEAREGRPFFGVKVALIGGGPMTPALLARARASKLPVLQTYGLTEASSQVATERPAEADGTTAGPALPGTTVEVVDAAGAPVAVGEVGEIRVRGPTVAPSAGPWLVTGDLGRLDARGRLTVVSRRVDLIVSGGENVYPLEVEAVLRDHPALADVAVVPREDARWGQVPVAFYVPRSPCTAEELAGFARARLAGFKVPKHWIPLEKLPRNALGKVERLALVKRAME
jgi:O-succinylbenzoic acid--CoA ligase